MAYGTYFERRVKRMLDGEFTPTFMAELMHKDVKLALNLARSAGVPTPLLGGDQAELRRKQSTRVGQGRLLAVVTHVVEKRIGRRVG